jgi:hypothetical protein
LFFPLFSFSLANPMLGAVSSSANIRELTSVFVYFFFIFLV